MLGALVIAAAIASQASVQPRPRDFGRSAQAWCDDRSGGDRASSCEVREATLAGNNPIDVDAGRNGGIRVVGWDRADALVRAKIVGYADTEAAARRIVAGVRIDAAGGRVRADGPAVSGDESWSVSFEVSVPASTASQSSIR